MIEKTSSVTFFKRSLLPRIGVSRPLVGFALLAEGITTFSPLVDVSPHRFAGLGQVGRLALREQQKHRKGGDESHVPIMKRCLQRSTATL